MKQISFFFYITALYATSVLAAGQKIELVKEKSSVEFLAIGKPSAIKIKGEKAQPAGDLSVSSSGIVSGQIKVDLDEFTTGMALRDRHMKEKYLETQKDGNRYATIDILKIDFPSDFWLSQKKGEYPFSGLLSLHGAKKEIQGQIKVEQRGSDSIQGSSHFLIRLTDFGIQIPSFAGITVAENVDVQVSFSARTISVK